VRRLPEDLGWRQQNPKALCSMEEERSHGVSFVNWNPTWSGCMMVFVLCSLYISFMVNRSLYWTVPSLKAKQSTLPNCVVVTVTTTLGSIIGSSLRKRVMVCRPS